MQNKDIRVPSTHGRFNLRASYSFIRQDKPMVLTGIEMKYRDADKSLARPGRKQAVAIEDFDVHISYLLS